MSAPESLRDFVAPARSMVIGGRPEAGQGEEIEVFNPATEERLAAFSGAATGQVERAVAAAQEAFPAWARTSRQERSRLLHRWADLIEEHAEELTADAVNEVGAPIAYAEFIQVRIGLGVLRWAADAALVDRTEHLGTWMDPWPSVSEVRYQPVGAVGCLVAYNAPNNMALFKAGPALAVGCTTVIMPSPRAPLSTLWLAELGLEAGLPPGVLNAVVGDVEGARLLTTHPAVDKISFTGSVQVGSEIMAQAAGTLKGVTLELGGKSPALLLEGSDVASLAPQVHQRWSRMAGQGCAAPTRLLVHESDHAAFAEASVAAMAAIKVGDPWDPETMVGPLIRPEQCARANFYLDSAREEGGHVIARSPHPGTGKGWYTQPTVIGGLDNNARAAREEIFGPVAVVIPYKDRDDMLRIANDSTLGLAAHVYGDVQEGLAIADELRAGTVWINGGGAMRPDAPFGGFKQSGIGREFGEWGIRDFLEPQHVQFRV